MLPTVPRTPCSTTDKTPPPFSRGPLGRASPTFPRLAIAKSVRSVLHRAHTRISPRQPRTWLVHVIGIRLHRHDGPRLHVPIVVQGVAVIVGRRDGGRA